MQARTKIKPLFFTLFFHNIASLLKTTIVFLQLGNHTSRSIKWHLLLKWDKEAEKVLKHFVFLYVLKVVYKLAKELEKKISNLLALILPTISQMYECRDKMGFYYHERNLLCLQVSLSRNKLLELFFPQKILHFKLLLDLLQPWPNYAANVVFFFLVWWLSDLTVSTVGGRCSACLRDWTEKRRRRAVWGIIANHRPANGSLTVRAWNRSCSALKGQEETNSLTGKIYIFLWKEHLASLMNSHHAVVSVLYTNCRKYNFTRHFYFF